jgi:RNA polymerase sigma factor (sigma-70 family)
MGEGVEGEVPEPSEEQQKLVDENLDVVRLAAEGVYRKDRKLELAELESIGWLALVTVAARWDPAGGEFARYAEDRVRGAMRNALRREHAGELRRAYTRGEIMAGKHLVGRASGTDEPRDPIAFDDFVDPTRTLSTRYAQAQLERAAIATVDEIDGDKRELVRAIYIDRIKQEDYARSVGKATRTIQRRIEEILPLLLSRLIHGDNR